MNISPLDSCEVIVGPCGLRVKGFSSGASGSAFMLKSACSEAQSPDGTHFRTLPFSGNSGQTGAICLFLVGCVGRRCAPNQLTAFGDFHWQTRPGPTAANS